VKILQELDKLNAQYKSLRKRVPEIELSDPQDAAESADTVVNRNPEGAER
jgi:hypothetical protein